MTTFFYFTPKVEVVNSVTVATYTPIHSLTPVKFVDCGVVVVGYTTATISNLRWGCKRPPCNETTVSDCVLQENNYLGRYTTIANSVRYGV